MALFLARAPALLVPALLLLGSGEAEAKGIKCTKRQDFGVGYLEAFATQLSVPPLAVNGIDAPRRLVGVPAPASGESLLGFGLGVQIRCSYLLDDLFSFRYSAALVGGGSGTTLADDSLVNVGRGGVQLIDLGVPFFGLPSGFQIPVGDAWKVSFKIDLGVEHLWSTATVSGAGVLPTQASIDSWDPYFRVQAGGCLRLGRDVSESTAWACLTVSPIVYDRNPFPGISGGLRVDL